MHTALASRHCACDARALGTPAAARVPIADVPTDPGPGPAQMRRDPFYNDPYYGAYGTLRSPIGTIPMLLAAES